MCLQVLLEIRSRWKYSTLIFPRYFIHSTLVHGHGGLLSCSCCGYLARSSIVRFATNALFWTLKSGWDHWLKVNLVPRFKIFSNLLAALQESSIVGGLTNKATSPYTFSETCEIRQICQCLLRVIGLQDLLWRYEWLQFFVIRIQVSNQESMTCLRHCIF